MKIAFVIRALGVGGAERQLVLLAAGLKQLGHEVSVTTFYPKGLFEADLQSMGIRLNVVGKRGRWDNLGFLLRAARILRRERADIVHAYLGGANIVIALLKRMLRPAKIVWGIRASAANPRDYDWARALSGRLEAKLARSADLIISNSETGRKDSVSTGFPESRTIVVPNGIDLAAFYIDREPREKIRTRWKIGADEVLAGRVARFDPMKDYPGFLEACALAFKMDKRFRFICIGSGPDGYISSLQKHAESIGISHRVQWFGASSEMRSIYNALDLLVSSSQYGEGFPNVLLEAMACGVPCVTTDVGDAGDVVGKMGITVPPREPELLAKAMVNLAGQRPTAEQLRSSVAERFSTQLLVARTDSHLRSLLTGASPVPQGFAASTSPHFPSAGHISHSG